MCQICTMIKVITRYGGILAGDCCNCRGAHLAVHLPHARQAVVQVVATLRANVDVVRVECGPVCSTCLIPAPMPWIHTCRFVSSSSCIHKSILRSPQLCCKQWLGQCSPPEEAPQPGHLAQGQVVLGGHVEVGHSQEADGGVQVGNGAVNSRVEGWDHCTETVPIRGNLGLSFS